MFDIPEGGHILRYNSVNVESLMWKSIWPNSCM